MRNILIFLALLLATNVTYANSAMPVKHAPEGVVDGICAMAATVKEAVLAAHQANPERWGFIDFSVPQISAAEAAAFQDFRNFMQPHIMMAVQAGLNPRYVAGMSLSFLRQAIESQENPDPVAAGVAEHAKCQAGMRHQIGA